MPASASIDPPLLAELEAVYALYAAFVCEMDADNGMGGRLICVGELDRDGCRLVRAANIAGAASLSATGDVPMQKHAIREGVIDFLVTSVDEALRILKNEVRKRNAVAVCVGAPPAQVTTELSERGVLPDLVREGSGAELSSFVAQGARAIEPAPWPAGYRLVILPSGTDGMEQRALDLIPKDDHAARRWLRISQRYLGPQARRIRSLCCDSAAAEKLTA
jgi:Urocanase Rossmann-like domain